MTVPSNWSAKAHPSVRRRLLFVVNQTDFFVSHRLPLALAARQRGMEVHLASPPGDGLADVSQVGIVWHVLPLERSSRNPVLELRSILALANLYRRLRPDLVHHVTMKPVLYGSLAARAVGVPAVVNAVAGLGHSFIAPGLLAGTQRRLIQTFSRIAFARDRLRIIFQNGDDLQAYVSQGIIREDQALLISGSGVDLDRCQALPEPTTQPTIVLAARMLGDKGVREFVDAARIVRGSVADARFVLVGPLDPGNPTAISLGELARWRNEGHIEWWDRRADVPEIFSASHVVCLPSYREGLPKVLMEAAACGRPVVTTDVPGCRHAVIPGETGILVPPRNARALADAIQRLIKNPTERRRMGLNARRLAEARFGVDGIVDATLSVYDALLR